MKKGRAIGKKTSNKNKNEKQNWKRKRKKKRASSILLFFTSQNFYFIFDHGSNSLNKKFFIPL